MNPTNLADVKIFYDQNGQAREVLISYEVFKQIAALLEELAAESDQSYFWSEVWQARIREAEADLQAGRVRQATAGTIDSVLEWLDE